MTATTNPYAAPKARVEDVIAGPNAEAETIRREHINHEASLKSVGLLYYLGAIGGGLGTLAAGFAALQGPNTATNAMTVGLLVGLAAMCIVFGYVGYGFRALRPWIRVVGTITSIIGLFNLGLGTIISIYVLWLIHSKKGKVVLGKDYPAIIAATPHVKYKTSIVVWIVLGLLLLLIVAGFSAALFGR